MEFKEQFMIYLEHVNTYLHSIFDNKVGGIYEAMRYSLYAGGKRVRPILSLACCEALDGDMNSALCFGGALEMIHTYSLIHDDLPCMDNDALRRGKPTNHIVFGEAMAVLAGDALLNYACESIAVSDCANAQMKLNALKTIYVASGSDGMIGGQVLDMEAENSKITAEQLQILHGKKTGRLINAAARLGAIAAVKEITVFDNYSDAIGLAFQIRDDILDVEGNIETFGKPIMSDEKNNKTTYVSLYGVDGAKHKLAEETQKALDSIEFLGAKGDFLRNFALYLLNRTN